MLQFDKSREYVNETVQRLTGQVKDNSNGCLCNQDLIEHGKRMVEKRVAVRLLKAKESKYPSWSEWFPFV